MNIVGLRRLEKFKKDHAPARASCESWRTLTEGADWKKFEDVRKTFCKTDHHKDQYIFDLADHYRLIATINFATQEVFIRQIMHHDQYDRGDWKK